jgi:hemolysin D
MKLAEIFKFPSSARARADETAFLPAALEIVETPAAPAGRAVAGILIVVFCTAVAWASLSQIDIVASAPGKIIASGRTKIIQPLEAGIVRAIHVSDGQVVRAGEVLVELDPTINESDRDHSQADLQESAG